MRSPRVIDAASVSWMVVLMTACPDRPLPSSSTDTTAGETQASRYDAGANETDTSGVSDSDVPPSDPCVVEIPEYGELCTLEQAVCGWLVDNTVVIPCGDLAIDDPDPLWQAAHDCVLAAVAEQTGYVLIYRMAGVEGVIGHGFGGQDPLLFVSYWVSWSDDGVGDPSLGNAWATTCSSVVATPGCVPGNQRICLDCPNFMGPLQHCGS